MAGILFVIGVGMMIATGVGCRSLPPPMPLDQLNPQQQRGHEVFQAKCARCHYDRKDAPLRGPTLLGVFKDPSLPSGAPANDDRVSSAILQGHNLMPAMRNSMSPADVDDVLAYLHTL